MVTERTLRVAAHGTITVGAGADILDVVAAVRMVLDWTLVGETYTVSDASGTASASSENLDQAIAACISIVNEEA